MIEWVLSFTSRSAHNRSFQEAVTCTGADDTEQTGENTPKTQRTGPR